MSSRRDLMGASVTPTTASSFIDNDDDDDGVAASFSARQQARRRASYGNDQATAGVHGRGSIGSVSAGLYNAFRERFLTGNGAAVKAVPKVSAYRALRQRDAEMGRGSDESSEEYSSNASNMESQLSSSSIEDLFASETRRKWRKKMTRRSRRSVDVVDAAAGSGRRRSQMGNRTGASASCEDLILEIELPEEQMCADKMQLSMQEREIDLGTTLYRLKLPLPHAVDVDRCHAKYDSEQKKLRLTLRLKRELDYINF